jgi:hypothetical protein
METRHVKNVVYGSCKTALTVQVNYREKIVSYVPSQGEGKVYAKESTGKKVN